MSMHWYDAGSWKTALEMSVYDTNQWKEMRACWIWDGSWKLCHYAPAQLFSFDVFDFGGGTLEFSWTTTSLTFPGDWEIKIDKSTDSGASWTNIATYATGDSPQLVTSLSASDWYRCRMILLADGTTQASGSPIVDQPPYPT